MNSRFYPKFACRFYFSRLLEITKVLLINFVFLNILF